MDASLAVASQGSALQPGQHFTTKIPPSFDGRMSWFAYEELVDDWVDITELPAERRAPALKNGLIGEASVYKSLLDRDRLRDPRDGVNYFKASLRPHFVKGASSVFLWRLFQVFRSHRGQNEFIRWLGRFAVLRKRLGESWMDLLEPVDVNAAPAVRQAVAALMAQREIPEAEAMALVDQERRREHQDRFPLSDNLLALIAVCLADLTEQQRERFSSAMHLQGYRVQDYTYEAVRSMFMELFCAPRSSLENPLLRSTQAAHARAFCTFDYGTLYGSTGYWVQDESTNEEGFLDEYQDLFWVYDDQSSAWASYPFQGRKVRKGTPKGHGKGKGHKGRNFFQPYRAKGKGKGKQNAYWEEDEEEEEDW